MSVAWPHKFKGELSTIYRWQCQNTRTPPFGNLSEFQPCLHGNHRLNFRAPLWKIQGLLRSTNLCRSLKGYECGWVGTSNPFVERTEKIIHNIGQPKWLQTSIFILPLSNIILFLFNHIFPGLVCSKYYFPPLFYSNISIQIC